MTKKVVKSIISAVLLIMSAIIVFSCGCGTSVYDWAVKTVEEYYYSSIPEEFYNEPDLKKAVSGLYLDRYCAYYTKSEYEALMRSNAGSQSGLGLTYSYVDGKGIYIATVYGNSPAYMSGLREGEWLKSGYTPGVQEVEFKSSADFAGLVTSVGTGVDITFNSFDGESYTAAKAEYTASYTYLSTNTTAWTFGDAAGGGLALYETPSEKISYLPDGAAYIRLAQFYGTAATEFYKLIEKFTAMNCTSLILDLRTDGGGYVNVMQEIAYSFSRSTNSLAMVAKYKNGKTENYYCIKGKSACTVPEGTKVYVLANANTASASEALIGAMICYGSLRYENIFLSDYSEEYLDWVTAAGEERKTAQTYGKGIMQSTFVRRPGGEAIKLTTAQIYWPDGTTSIHERGVTVADGCKAVAAEWERTKSDDELQSVIAMIAPN